MLSRTSFIVLPSQKVRGNCHVSNVTIFPTRGVSCNACHSKSMVQKLGLLCGFIATNDEHVLWKEGRMGPSFQSMRLEQFGGMRCWYNLEMQEIHQPEE
jgi:hypothetical protein